MIIIDASPAIVDIVLAEAVSSTQPVCQGSYVDITTTTFTPGSTGIVNCNGTIGATLFSSPAASTQRQVKMFTVYNSDTIPHTVIPRLSKAGLAPMGRYYLQPNECLIYTDTDGFRVSDVFGGIRQGSALYTQNPPLYTPDWFVAVNLTTTKSHTSGTTYFQYLGRADKQYSNIALRYRVTTLAATITWAEAAIYTGTPTDFASPPLLTRAGYTDISGVVTSTGLKTTAVAGTILPGQDIWAAFGNAATTVMVLRGGLADDLQVGYIHTSAIRPSTTSSLTPTLGSGTEVPNWIAWRGY